MRSRPQAVEEFLQKVGSRKKGVVPRKHLVPFMQQNSEPSLASSLLFSWAVRPDWRVLHGRCALYSRGGELIILDVPAICSVMTSSLSLTQRSCPTPSTPRCSLEGGARSASLLGPLSASPAPRSQRVPQRGYCWATFRRRARVRGGLSGGPRALASRNIAT